MFVFDIKINTERIDRILVQRIKSTKAGYNTYKIVEPKGFEKLKIRHHYDEGYFPLLVKVVNLLSEKGFGPAPPWTWKQLQKLIKQRERDLLVTDYVKTLVD